MSKTQQLRLIITSTNSTNLSFLGQNKSLLKIFLISKCLLKHLMKNVNRIQFMVWFKLPKEAILKPII